ncbi:MULTISPECIES: TetR/AcrR family transcriptional regulator [unclassified Bradyrhizobium]|uniref:TetR/AcrR family transcriptional regulator n=1 Tax=unclassified Bradyrhizobium TaxID=2631580 RepID=UPI00247B08FE|nr:MULTISPECIES: TetR/AcrR family transcriptional regulator [unclassified Bradyrhizobium]WGS19894.1 TetR/AcrR family transcriptional regulator [Bradyrhizobium sp. ISRA463]WGS26748.1 TetR/AcrR family transcriptional regulator [Bradyrhizobium sp. ISRA464]
MPKPGKSGGVAGAETTRTRILNAAVECLIATGVAGTTTLAVQHRAEVSRGALLHHFPTHASLLAASVAELVRRNERAVSQSRAGAGPADSLAAAVEALAFAARQPAYLAELELWAVARTDSALRQALIAAERGARRDLDRVYFQLFGEWTDSEAYDEVIALTLHFIRGLAISENLRSSAAQRERLVAAWVDAMRTLLERNRKVGPKHRNARG